jgi:hypothetical protein
LTFSLRVLPALNLTTFDAGILITSPVRGLRPSRSDLAPTLKVPKPASVNLSPPDKASETVETNPCTTFSACDLVMPAKPEAEDVPGFFCFFVHLFVYASSMIFKFQKSFDFSSTVTA